LLQSPGPPPENNDLAALGRWGERAALLFLRRNGYRILRTNFRAPQGGEVDIVARDIAENMLVFTEVKTRRSEEFSRPSDAVDEKKQQLIARGAMYWLRLLNRPDLRFRFDIVEVIARHPPEVRLLRNAFELPDYMHY
jgi:putative endonuclease